MILTEIDAILEGLLRDAGASRVTLRQDLPGDYAFPVTRIISLHQLGTPRVWTDDEVAACTSAAASIAELL